MQVDITKVNMELIKKWVSDKLSSLLGFEDEEVSDVWSKGWVAAKFQEHFLKMDTNNDGYLDYEELDKQMRSAMLKHFLTEEQNAKKHSGQLFNVSHDCFLLRSIRLAVNLAS